MFVEPAYHHVQRSLLCLLLYAVAGVDFALVWILRDETPMQWMFLVVGVFVLLLAASFHYLEVTDRGDSLLIRFGPMSWFRRMVRYADIVSVEQGRTALLDGWGLHWSPRGGWLWNIGGRDCVVLRLKKGMLRIGSDDAENLTAFLRTRIRYHQSSKENAASF